MRFSTSTIIASLAVASTVSAQTALTPIALLGYAATLLSPSCRTTVTSLVSNSTLSQCLNVQGLLPILQSNTSLIAPINTYITSVCASPACTNATITNATNMVLSSCATDLKNFGVANSTVRTVMNAYQTAREVACLSTNNTVLVGYTNGTLPAKNSTNATSSVLCPTSLLSSVQTILGVPLTNTYIDSLILGANSTAYNQLISTATNITNIKKLACNDCFAASVDVVLENYPALSMAKINLLGVSKYLNGTGIVVPANMSSFTVPQIYGGVCNITVGYNVTLPKSIRETAFNTTLPYNATAATNRTAISARGMVASVEAKKRFAKWM